MPTTPSGTPATSPGVAGRGRAPGPSESEERERRRRRAVDEPLDVQLRRGGLIVELEVRNPLHRTRYRVLFPEYPSRESALCTCTDFARRGLGTCKHLEAGWEWLRSQGEPPARPSGGLSDPEADLLWGEVDRRLARWAEEPPGSIRDLERIGAVLYDGAEPVSATPEGGRPERGGRRGSTPTSRAPP